MATANVIDKITDHRGAYPKSIVVCVWCSLIGDETVVGERHVDRDFLATGVAGPIGVQV